MSSGMQAADGITDLFFHSPPTALVSVLPPQDVPRTRVADQVYIDELTGDVVTLSSYETRSPPPSNNSSSTTAPPPFTRRSCEARFYGNPVVPLEAVGSCGATSAASLQNDRETYQRTNYLITSITLATSSSKAGSSAKTIVAARRFPRPVQVRTAATTATPSSPTSPTTGANTTAAGEGYELRYLIALSMDDQTIHFYITPPAYAGSGDLQPISVGSYACSPNTLRFRQSSYPIRGFQWCPNSAVSDHWRQHQSTKASRAATPESLAELSLTATSAHTDDPTDVWANANRSFYYRSKVLLGGGGYSVPPPPETGDLPLKKLLKSLPPSARDKAHRIFQQACGSATGEALGLAEMAHGVSLSSAVEQLHTCLQRDQLLMVWTEIGVDLVYVNFTRDSTTGVSAAQKRDAFEHLASPLGGASSSSGGASSSSNGAEPSGIISPNTSGCTGMIVVLRRVPTRIDFWTTLPSMHVSLVINSAKSTNVKPIAELGAYTWIMPQFKIPGLNPITPPAAPKYRTQQAAIAAARLPQSFVANMQFPTAGPHLSTNMLFPTISSTEGGTTPTYATGAWSQTSHISQITQPQSFYPLQVLQLHDELYVAFVDYSKGHVVMYRYQHNNHSGRTADLASAMLSDDFGDRYAQWAQNNSTVTTTNRPANPARSGASTLVRYFNAAVDSGATPGSSFASAERRAGGGPDAMASLPVAADLLRGASEANLTEEEKDHILRIATEAAAAIAEDVKGLDVEGLTGSDGFRGNLRRLQVCSKLQPLSDYASDPYKVVDQEFQVGTLVAEGQPMPALTTLSNGECGSDGVSAPLSNQAAHALLGRGLQGVSAAASTYRKSSSSSGGGGGGGGGGVPLPCAFVPIPDVVAQVVSALEKGASSSGPSASGSNQPGGSGGQYGDASNVARPPTMGLSNQQPGAGAGSASQSSVLTSKGTSCFVSCYPSARGGATKDGKGFVPSDPSMTGGSMSAAGEQQEGSMATFVVAFVLPLPAHSIVSALRAEWYFGADVQATYRWSEALRAAADDTLLTSSNTPLLPPYAVLLQTTSDGLLIAHIPDDGKLAQEVKSEIDAEEFDPLLDGGGSSTGGGDDGIISSEEDSQRVAEEVLRPCHLVAAYDVKLAMLKDDTSAPSGILAQQQRGLSPMDSNYYSSIRQQQIASTAVSAAGRFVAQHAGLFLKQLHVLPVAPPAPLNPTSSTLTSADTQAIEALEAYELNKTQYLEQSRQIMSDFNCHDARAQCTRYMASYTSHFAYHRLAPFSPVAFAELKDQIIEATSMEAMQTNASTSKGPSRKIARRLHRAMVEGKAQWVTSLMAARFQELSNQRSEASRRTIDGVSSVPPTSLYSTDSTFQELARNMNGAVTLAMASGGRGVGGRWSASASSSTVPDSKRGTMRPSGKQGSSLVATIAAVEAQQRMSSAARGSMAADSSTNNSSGGSSKGGWFRNLFSKNRDDGSTAAVNSSGSDAALVLSTEGTDVHEGVPIVHHLPLWCLEGALPNSILDKLVQSPRGNTSIPPVALCAGSTRVVIGGSQPRLLNSWSTPTVPTLSILGDMGLAPSSTRRSNSDNRPPVHLLPPSYRFVSTIVGYNAMAIVRSFGVDHEAMWSWWPVALRRLMLQGTLSTDELDALDGLPSDDGSPPGKTSSRKKQGRLSALPPMSVTGGLSCPRSRLPFGVYDASFIFAVQFLLYRRAHAIVAYKEAGSGGGNTVETDNSTSTSSVFVVPFAEIVSRLALHTALNFESLSLVGRIFDVMVAHQRSHITECSWFNFWQSRWRGAMIADSGVSSTTASNVSLTSESTQTWRSLLIEGFLMGSSLSNVITSTPDTTAEFVRYVRSLYQPHLWSINTAYHVGGGSTRRELLLSTYYSSPTSVSSGANSMGSATSSADDVGSGSFAGNGGIDGRLSLHLVRPAVDAGHMYRSVFEELLRLSESCRATTSVGTQQSFGPSGARLEGVFVRNYVLHCFFEYARSLVQHGLSLSVPLQSSLIDLMLSTAKPLPQQQQHITSTSANTALTGTPPNATTASIASSGTPTSIGGRSPVSAYSEPHQGSEAGGTESSYFRLHQLLMYKALEDHVPTALQLISLHSDYPPAFQLGLDILSRLRAHSEIIMVFLSKGMPLRAAKYLLSLKRDTIAAHGSLTRQLVKLQSGGGDKDEDPTGDNARRTLQNLQTVSHQLYPSNTDLFSVIGILDSAAAMHDAELLSLSAEGEVTPGPTLPAGEEDLRTERQKVTVYLRNRLITKRQKYKQELGAAGAQFYSIYTLVVTQYLDLAVRSRSNDGASKNGSFTNTSSSVAASQLLLHFPNLKPFKVRYDLINSGNISGLYLLVQNTSSNLSESK